MINYKNPDYTEVFFERQERLANLRADPKLLSIMKVYYKDNPWDFINDWGMTFDPRQLELGKNASIPFILWPRQREFLHWLDERWKAGEYGIVEKSRDCGVTWLAVGFCAAQWLFLPGFSAGFGSALEKKVDRIGDPDCIFEKIRFFIKNVPEDFMPAGYNQRTHNGFMKLVNPENEATITGDCGIDMGRGGRKSIYLVDEAAHVENQLATDHAISMATNCHIDIGTYNGNGNLFYKKAVKFAKFEGGRHKFIFDWTQDPRKDAAWYAKQKAEKDPITVAQEIDRDPNASAEDTFIPSLWIQAAVDLHKLIKVPPTGIRTTAFDPADVGDAKTTLSRHGYIVNEADLLSDGDIMMAIPWAYEKSFKHRSDVLVYDADGMGAPTMKLTLKSHSAGIKPVIAFYGSGEVQDKKQKYGKTADTSNEDLRGMRTNGDTFVNFRAQAATWLRDRFEAAYNIRMQIEKGGVVLSSSCEDIISIDSECKNFFELIAELSRPKRLYTNTGKIKVESKKEMKARNVESPNLFDTCMMAFAINKIPRQNTHRHTTSRRIRIRDRGLGL